MMARSPTERCRYSVSGKTNQMVLDRLFKSLKEPREVTNAFNFGRTKQGVHFWNRYMMDGNGKGIRAIHDLIEELSISRPFNKEDWL